MDLSEIIDPQLFNWVVLPLLIFFSRVLDVSLGTMRIIFLSRGKRLLAPVLGFFEVLIWIVVVSQVIANLSNWLSFVAYAAGFAAGNYIGMALEERLALGTLAVRMIVPGTARPLIIKLHDAGYGVTHHDAEGSAGHVKVIYTIIMRKDLNNVMDMINEFNPKLFFSVEEVRTAHEGIFPATSMGGQRNLLRLLLKKK